MNKLPVDHVILSCNEHWLYFDFWPLVAYAYRTLFPNVQVTLAFVTERDEADIDVLRLRDHGRVIRLPLVRGIPVAAQAKLARYYLASLAPYGEVALVDDLDQIPIDRDWHIGKVSQRQPGTMFTIGAEVYAGEYPDQAPAGMMTAESQVFRDLFNPSSLYWPQWILSFAERPSSRPHTNLNARSNHEGMDSTTKQEILGPLFSDEALIADLRAERAKEGRPVPVTSVARNYTVGVDTIDRGCWPFDIRKLEAGKFISAHTGRPLERFFAGNIAIVDYIRRRYEGDPLPHPIEKKPQVDTDMIFGGSGLVKEAFEWICDHIPAQSMILELGSGHVSTNYLSRYYWLASIESDLTYVNLYPSHYIYAPLINDRWYDPAIVKRGLDHPRIHQRAPFKLCIIDGPVGGERRLGVLEHLDLLPLDCPVLVDDTWRQEERQIAAVISHRTGRPVQAFEFFSVI